MQVVNNEEERSPQHEGTFKIFIATAFMLVGISLLFNALGIYTGLRRKDGEDKDGLRLMNADSTPQLVEYLTEEEIINYVEAMQERI